MTLNLVNSMEKDENNKFTDNAITVGNNFNVDYNGNLKCTNANISGTINATAGKIGDCNIEDGTLKIAEANISEKLTANAIDVDNLNVNSANIANSVNTGWVYAGNITAEQISGGTIGGNVVYAGTISAGNISGGTLDFSKLGAAGTSAIQGLTWNMIQASSGGKNQTIGSSDSKLDNIYAENAAITDATIYGNILMSYTGSGGSSKLVYISGDGVALGSASPKSWADILGGTVKAVFGA